MRRLSTRVLEHLHALSLRYHLERQTGALSRDLERGTRSVSSSVEPHEAPLQQLSELVSRIVAIEPTSWAIQWVRGYRLFWQASRQNECAA